MIAGPRGVGKKMLVHSICTETGANLFDITPANVAGKFAGKKGLDMLLHMVFKVRTNVQWQTLTMPQLDLKNSFWKIAA